MKRVAIIILNWNQEADTVECLTSLKALKYENYEIILVDNGSHDGSPDILQKQFPNIKMIRNPKNLGFVGGNNVGIKETLKTGADYILLLNNDTVVEPDFLSLLVQTMENDKTVGVVSPKIMFYHDRKKIWFVGGNYLPIIRKTNHKHYGEVDCGQVKKITDVAWVSGCCMLIKREVVEKVGLFDPDYFNNYEDVDFCERAKVAGYKIMLVPQAKIYHKFAASMGGKFSPYYTYYRTRNNLLFYKKTKQWLALALNFLIFPAYSIIMSAKNIEFGSIKTTFQAIFDFLRGKYGELA